MLSKCRFLFVNGEIRLFALKYFHLEENLVKEYEGYAATLFSAFKE